MKNKLKTLSIMVIALLSFTAAHASHLMGGEIWVEKNAAGNHILKHKNFRDVLGIPAYLSTDFVAFKWDPLASVWSPVNAPTNMTLEMPMDPINSGFLLQGVPYGVEVYNYESNINLLDAIFAAHGNGTYRFYANECCRNAAIQNLSVKTSMIIHCEYTYDNTAANQSPRFLTVPVFFGPVNNAWVYNPLPFDPDADSIAWVVDTPVCNADPLTGAYMYCGGYSTPPSVATGPFTLNNATGQLDWTPSMTGNFVASFIVTEYRNGIEIGNSIRDMQYIVVPDSNSNGPIAMPEFTSITNFGTNNPNSNSEYNYVYYYPGMPFEFNIAAQDINNNDVLSMTAFSTLLNNNSSNATFSYAAAGVGNTVNGTFSWTPAANEEKDQMVVIRANDGQFSKDFTLVLKKFVAPTSVQELSKDELNITVYPNPAKAHSDISFEIVSQEAMKNIELQIIDLTGKTVLSQTMKNLAAGSNTIQLDQDLQAGFYFAQLVDVLENKKQVIKFVVQ